MLIEAITFEIRDFKNGIQEEFVVENTIENQEKVFSHRLTRDIKFTKFLDFDFGRKMRIPSDFLGEFTDVEPLIDPIDEMVGVFA
jgi:hypothetical protein